MASLVADYSSSDENDVSEIDATNSVTQKSEHREEPSESNSSSSDDDENEKVNVPEESLHLPSPSFSAFTFNDSDMPPVGTVFSNQYFADEVKKSSILQQHVQLTSAEVGKTKDGKPTCWKFRKGKCRKGARCKFAHDNDIASEIKPIQYDRTPQIQSAPGGHIGEHRIPGARPAAPKPPPRRLPGQELPEREPSGLQLMLGPIGIEKEASGGGGYLEDIQKQKKRCGVTNTLYPPKKYMKKMQKNKGT